jgi:hypothetical protein
MGDDKLTVKVKLFDQPEEVGLRDFFQQAGKFTLEAQDKLSELPKDLKSERFKKRMRISEKLSKRKELKRNKPKTKKKIKNKKSKRRR